MNYLALSVEAISAHKNKDQKKKKIQSSLRKIETKQLDLNLVYT